MRRIERLFGVVRELYRYRALVLSLVGREIRARYRGSFLGFLWTFMNPLLLLLVYSVVFSFVTRVQMENYTFFLLTGLLPWVWFSSGVLSATSSISERRDLLTKVRIAPEVMPFVAVLSNGFNFVFSLPILLAFALASGAGVSADWLALPALMLVQLVFTVALALGFALINVFFRDLQHILGNLMTLWFFICPIIYRYEDIPANLRALADFDPIAVIIRGYQAIFFAHRQPNWASIAAVLGVSLVILVGTSLLMSRHRESLPERI